MEGHQVKFELKQYSIKVVKWLNIIKVVKWLNIIKVISQFDIIWICEDKLLWNKKIHSVGNRKIFNILSIIITITTRLRFGFYCFICFNNYYC